MPRALIDVVGDSASALRALDQVEASVSGLTGSLDRLAATADASGGGVAAALAKESAGFSELAVNAERSTAAIVAASVTRADRLKAEAVAARELSTSYAFGSAEQIAATNLYERRISQIARVQGTAGLTADEAAQLQVSATMRQVAALDTEAAAYGRVAEAAAGAAAKIAAANAAQAAANRDRLLGVEAATSTPSMTQTAGTIGRGLTTYVTAPTAFIGYEAVKQAVDFSQAILLIRTQAGASEAELERMNHDVLQLVQSGHSYGQSAHEMAQGLYYVESEGIRGGRALAIIEAAAAGAAKGQTSMADTTNALTSAMRIWNLDAGQAVHTMATIDAITATGKMHLEDLNSAFQTKFFTTAHQLGIPLEQAGAALDVFTKAGVPAEVAANNMTTSFIKMLTPAKAAAPYLQQLGLTSDSLGQDLQQGGLSKALASLASGYEHLIQTQGKFAANRAVLESFGGSRSGAPALALVQQYGSYLKSLGEIQRLNNPATFWSQVSQAMHQPAMKIKQDVAEVGADFIKLGVTLAPEVAALAHGVADIAGEFQHLPGPVKDAALATAAILAIGGPVGLAIKGVGVLVGGVGSAFNRLSGQAGTDLAETDAELAALQAQLARTGVWVQGAGGAFARIPAEAGPAIASTDGELGGLQERLAATAADVGALGASFERLPAMAAPGIMATEGELSGLGAAGAGSLLGRLGPAGLYAAGGFLAGQIAGSVIPGEGGSIVKGGLEGAGLGAAVGSIVPGIGTLIGAGVGAGLGTLAEGVSALIHDGPSFTQQMTQMSQSVHGFGTDAGAAAADITQLHGQIAQLRLSRDQLERRIAADRSAVAQAPGSRVARDQLLADLAQLQSIDSQIEQANNQITVQDRKRTRALQDQRDAIAQIVSRTQDLATVTPIATRAGIAGWEVGGQMIAGAKTQLQAYESRLLQLAQSAESSDPRLAHVYYKLHDIAVQTGKIPGHKRVEIVVDAQYTKGAKELLNLFGLSRSGASLDSAFKDMFKGLKPPDAHGKDGNHPPPPITTFQLPERIQIELAKAQAGYGNLAKAQADARAYTLQLIHSGRLQGQALVDAYNELASLNTKATTAANKATAAARRTQTAFDRRVTEDQLLARARLDLADGEVAASRVLLEKDRMRLQALLAEAATSDERVTVLRQLAEVTRMLHTKSDQFQLSPKLQEEMARADALAALQPNLQGPTALQIQLAKEAKAEAMRAIRSHQLTMEGLIAAWQQVAQDNAILAQTKAGIDTYHAVSTAAITRGLGLSHDQDMALRERLAQEEAHRGYAPNGPAVDGHVITNQPRHHHHHHHHAGGSPAIAEMAPVHIDVKLIGDLRKIISEVEAYRRTSHQRAGGRR